MVDVVGSLLPMILAFEGAGPLLSPAISQDSIFDLGPLGVLDCDIRCRHSHRLHCLALTWPGLSRSCGGILCNARSKAASINSSMPENPGRLRSLR